MFKSTRTFKGLLITTSILALGLVLSGCDEEGPVSSTSPEAYPFRSLAAPPAPPQDPVDPYRVLVETTDSGFTKKELEDLGIEEEASYPEINVTVVSSSADLPSKDLAEQLLEDPSVLSAQPDVRVETPESRGMTISFSDGFTYDDYVDQDFAQRLGVHKAHQISLGAGIVVAIVDTGIDPNHPDLAGVYAGGYDFLDMDNLPMDETDGLDEDGDGLTDEAYGHGTHIAGVIALLAPEADILAYRILSAEGWGTASSIAEAIIKAVDDGADVINLSLGMYSNIRAVELALDYAARHGVAVFASAGNDGTDSYAQYPASFSTAEAVASVDNMDVISGFSSFGNHVFVTAPGEGILSIAPGGGYVAWSGTSMATPMATALYALLKYHLVGFTRHGLLDFIASTTAPGTAIPGVTGNGRIDYASAFQILGQIFPIGPRPPLGPPGP